MGKKEKRTDCENKQNIHDEERSNVIDRTTSSVFECNIVYRETEEKKNARALRMEVREVRALAMDDAGQCVCSSQVAHSLLCILYKQHNFNATRQQLV